jgi:enoyl-CoA hydratase/carnithine racemase
MQILTNLEGPILRLQINRPEKRNALTTGMYEQMTSALQERSAVRASRSSPPWPVLQ